MSISFLGGDNFNTGSGIVSVENASISQNIALASTDAAGNAVVRARLFFAGNGVDSYLVKSSYVTDGTNTVPVKISGASTFYIPAFGRWSDYFSTASFTLLATVSFVSILDLKVPLLMPGIGGNQSGESAVGAVTTTEQAYDGDINAPKESFLCLNFNGINGATSWEEEAQGISPSFYNEQGVDGALDTSSAKFGTASLKMVATDMCYNKKIGYILPIGIIGDFTYHGFIKVSGTNNFVNNDFYWAAELKGDGGNQVTFRCNPSNGNIEPNIYFATSGVIIQYSDDVPIPFIEGQQHHFCIIFKGNTIMYAVDGLIKGRWTTTDNSPNTGLYKAYFHIYRLLSGEPFQVNYDAWELVNYAKWDNNFTPPTMAPPSKVPELETISITSIFTVTVTNNDLVDVGDTITITKTNPNTGAVIIIIYAFVNAPTGVENEIIIGAAAGHTAANIATTIAATYGAEFTATVDGAIVTVTANTYDTINTAEDSPGLSVSDVTKTILYNSIAAGATPSFTGNAFSSEHGVMGDVYNLTTIPRFTGESTSPMADFNMGSGRTPLFYNIAHSFVTGCTASSSDADKIALMLYGNDWMSWFAGLVAIPGDGDDVALVTTQWIAKNIAYMTDVTNYGLPEYWADPRRTLSSGAGDCEDFAFLLASMLLNNGIAPSRVRVYIGTMSGVGHAWVCYKRQSDNQWIILDGTKG
jgi:hypothetical protein